MPIDCVKTGGGSDSERKEEEQEEMKLGVMSFKRIEKEAVSVTSVVKALLQERGREMECVFNVCFATCPIISSPPPFNPPLERLHSGL